MLHVDIDIFDRKIKQGAEVCRLAPALLHAKYIQRRQYIPKQIIMYQSQHKYHKRCFNQMNMNKLSFFKKNRNNS